MKQQVETYNAVARVLHWMIALLIITNYILGLTLDNSGLYGLHKQIGVTILGLVILRILWRLTHVYPGPARGVSRFEGLLGKVGHKLLYIFMLAVPISGWLMSNAFGHTVDFLGYALPNLIGPQANAATYLEVHEVLANTFMVIVGLHVLGALKHHFIDRTNTLRRMLHK